LASGLLWLGGCSELGGGNESSDGKIRAVATTGMIADMVRQIGGDWVIVEQLIQSGVDPHLYKPIRDDVVAIMASSVVFYNGLKLEGRMADLLSGNVAEGRVHIAMSDALDADMLLGEPGHDAIDPHIWMDVSMWKRATQLIQAELVRRLPQHAEIMTQRAEELRARLSELDRRGLTAMATIPESQRVLISSHDAFQYFGRRYGLRVEGVQGISTASEAGLSRIPELIQMIGERKVPAVFKESSVAGRMIDAIIEGAAARGIHLQVGPELYSDALGATGSGADTYEGMMAHNFQSVAESLGGRWE
jgi:manganese/zinc/iron transport system substrate-binding protein